MTAGSGLVAVTGANGFVGSALCRRLVADGVPVRALVRDATSVVPAGCTSHRVGDLATGAADWPAALADVDVVFHLAAIGDGSPDVLRAVNVEATAALATAAFARGSRLVHVSSIKVYGDARDEPLADDTAPRPADDYGRTKLAAEQAIAAAAVAADGRWVALRPPIVYGAAERGNFARLIRLACAGWPLPFARIANRRSMIHVDVLVDALVRAAAPDAPSGRAFVVAGGPALSTADWLRHIARAADRPLRLWALPVGWMFAGAALVGARGIAERLLGSLAVDDRGWRAAAGWQPPLTQDDAITATVLATVRSS